MIFVDKKNDFLERPDVAILDSIDVAEAKEKELRRRINGFSGPSKIKQAIGRKTITIRGKTFHPKHAEPTNSLNHEQVNGSVIAKDMYVPTRENSHVNTSEAQIKSDITIPQVRLDTPQAKPDSLAGSVGSKDYTQWPFYQSTSVHQISTRSVATLEI